MSLGVALEEAGWTQADLARKLGVSSAAVNQWVSGARDIPLERQEQVEALLGATSSAMVNYQTIFAEARTVLSFVVLWPINDSYPEHDLGVRTPESLERRVRFLARELDATKLELEDALYGRGLLTAKDVIRIGQRFKVNPKHLAGAVGHKLDEWEQVEQSLEEAQGQTFDEVVFYLKREKLAYESLGLTAGPGAGDEALDDGREGFENDLDWWVIGKMGAGVRGRSEVEQDFSGRFKSTEGGK